MIKDRKILIRLAVLITATALLSFIAAIGVVWKLGYFNARYELSFDKASLSYDTVKKFNDTRSILKDAYYQKIDENVLLEGAISGMADSLKDPYTVYYNKEQMTLFTDLQKKTENNYVGIGVPVTLDNSGIVTILDPFDDSPAKAAGLKQGDKILKVEGKDVTGVKDEAIVVALIKGEENTKVTITIYRPSDNSTMDFDVMRKKINAVLNIRSEMIGGNIAYIKLKLFDENISANFEAELKKLLAQGAKGLIIDVRDNPGGLYNEVVEIADRLLPKGTIVYTEDRQGNKKVQESDSNQLAMPIAILVNGNSASASEILAGALKDSSKGTLIGTTTFGKGLVQTTHQFSDGTGIKITIARYFTPSGICIHGIGIAPDIEVQPKEKYKDQAVSQIPEQEDAQRLKAIEVIREKLK